MKKSYLFSAMLAALMLAGCAESVETPQQPQTGTGQAAIKGETPVGFTAYQERSITRGGLVGEFTIDAIRKPVADGGGFGVFAYYTDLKKYDQTYIPNFMYNQLVYDANQGSGTANWTYSPLLYWPNEYGSDAQSDDEDKVSFFAYAPYVEATSPAAGSVENAEWGITGFSRNTTAGDPIVKYIASFDPAKSVDLCWGVCNQTSWAKIEGSTVQTMSAGLPWLNVEHPKAIDQKMTFNFKHALAQLNVQIDADPDLSTHNETAAVAAETKIYVRSISFTGIAMQGALNLNNTVSNTATWLDYSGTTDLPYGQSVTVKDGRRDGREGTSGAEAKNETPTGLNSAIIQSSDVTTGVTHTLQNLFQPQTVIDANSSPEDIEKALKEPVYVIPTGETMSVTIVYDIETESDNLTSYLSDGTTHGVSIENRITQTVEFNGGGLENGKNYTLKLHLGLNSVKFDAAVSGWVDGASGAAWLPSNTGTGEFNANNPLTVTSLNGVANPGVSGAAAQNDPSQPGYNPAMTGATATKMTITGLTDNNGDPNYAQVNAGNKSAWSVSPSGVIEIANNDASGTRGFMAETRAAGDLIWTTNISKATKIKIKPLKAGTAKITATDSQGNTSSIVVTVDAPQVLLDQSAITLYKFNAQEDNEFEKGLVKATIKAAEGSVIVDNLSTATVVTNSYQSYKEATGTDLNSSVTLNDVTGALDENKNRVIADPVLDPNTGEITITPTGVGVATVTVTSEKGATASFKVTVRAADIKLSATAMTLIVGDSKTLTYTPNPAEDDNYTISFTNSDSGVATFENGRVTAVAVGETTITFNYEGRTGDHDPVRTCVVTVLASDPTEMKIGAGVMETNPLYKVAQYNVAAPNNNGTPDDASDDTYTFEAIHSTVNQYGYNWTDATTLFPSGGASKISGYHLPTYDEQVKVIPSDNVSGSGANIFGGTYNDIAITDGTYFEYPKASATEAIAKSGKGYFYRKAANDYYAVRVIDGVLTAWHYKWGNYNNVPGLKIDAYVLKKEATEVTDLDAAKVILGALPEAEVWSTWPNEADTEAASETTSYCMRFLPAAGRTRNNSEMNNAGLGNVYEPSGVTSVYVGTYGHYWSATASGGNAFYWHFFSGYMYEYVYTKQYGWSVRLFRD